MEVLTMERVLADGAIVQSFVEHLVFVPSDRRRDSVDIEAMRCADVLVDLVQLVNEGSRSLIVKALESDRWCGVSWFGCTRRAKVPLEEPISERRKGARWANLRIGIRPERFRAVAADRLVRKAADRAGAPILLTRTLGQPGAGNRQPSAAAPGP